MAAPSTAAADGAAGSMRRVVERKRAMKDTLAVGLATTRRITVDQPRTVGFMGEAARVYATPALVLDIERICRDLLLEHCDPGEDSVGTRIELDHLAATLLDQWVEITVTVDQVARRKVGFTLEAKDAVEPVARGRHDRFVIDVAKTEARLKAKAAKLKEA
jgi:predicted thioesterase